MGIDSKRFEGKNEKTRRAIAEEEIVARACEDRLANSRLMKEFIAEMDKKESGLAQKFSNFLGEAIARLKKLFQQIFSTLSRSKEAASLRKLTDSLEAIQSQYDALLERRTTESTTTSSEQQKNTSDRGVMSAKRGIAPDGKPIYESNFKIGTPKAAKSERILNYIKNVWSKKPIALVISNGETSRTIYANFDPTYDEQQNIPTDASKLAGGNKHGRASEKRVTLDLADDYYEIASEAKYNYSKLETGKQTGPHIGVKMWHYFVNDIYFAEKGEKEYKPYTVTINVKEKADGVFVYSFNAEKESSTRRTLHADVNTKNGANGELFLDTSISDPNESVKSENSPTDKGEMKSDRGVMSAERKVAKNKKTGYNEYRTNAMQWANSFGRSQDDRAIFFDPIRNNYYFIAPSSDSDMGYIELAFGTKNEMEEINEEYERTYNAHTLSGNIDKDIQRIRDEQNDDDWDNDFPRYIDEEKKDDGLSSDEIRRKADSGRTRNPSRTRENSKGIEESAAKGEMKSDRGVMSAEREVVKENYLKPITIHDVNSLRSIGRKSVFDFTPFDIEKAQKWAYKFYQDLGVKSPFFRAWFGEWRENDFKTRMPIINIPEYVKSNEKRKENRGIVSNADTGWTIRISREGETNTISHSGTNRFSEFGLAAIKDLTKNAVLLDSEIHKNHSSKTKNDRITFDHKFYSVGKTSSGEINLYRITVEEIYQDIKHPSDMRFHNLKYIEKVAENIGSLTQRINLGAESTSDVSTTKISVSDLYFFVKMYDEEFVSASKPSVLINADGTPKVMYHGTRAENGEFYVFDESKAVKKGGLGLKALGKGNYFTAKKLDGTERYGSRVIEAYLSIKKPFVYEGGTSLLEQVGKEFGIRTEGMSYEDLQKEMRRRKYDGVIQYDSEGEVSLAVAFDSNQIKSATDNIGTFDRSNPDIRYADRATYMTARELLLQAAEKAKKQDEQNPLLREYANRVTELDKKYMQLEE